MDNRLNDFSVFALKTLHASGGVDKFLLSGEERMAIGTDVEPEVGFQCALGLPLGTAGTGHFSWFIFGMNTFFHFGLTSSLQLLPADITRRMKARALSQASAYFIKAGL